MRFFTNWTYRMGLIIRKAENSLEISKLLNIREIVFVHEQNVPRELEIDEHDKCAIHFIVLNEDDIIGTARLVISDKKGKIGRMCILKEYRSKGIGSKLINKIIEYSKTIGLKYLYLNAQKNAISFYKKNGFIVKGYEFMDAGIPHKRMLMMLGDSNFKFP